MFCTIYNKHADRQTHKQKWEIVSGDHQSRIYILWYCYYIIADGGIPMVEKEKYTLETEEEEKNFLFHLRVNM